MMKNRNMRFLSFFAAGVGVAILSPETLGQVPCPVEIPGSTCVCSESVSDITVCAEWTEPGSPPERNVHFFVDFGCPGCSVAPDVQLKAGSTWTIRSRKSDGSFGDIGVLSSPWPDNFNVKLGTGYNDPGAQNVGSINLNPSGAMGDPNWASLVGGAIRGDLTGALVVSPNSSGVGGECTLFIGGSMQGKGSIETVQVLSIYGRTTAPLVIGEIATWGQLVLGDPTINGCTGAPTVTAPITIGVMQQESTLMISGPLGGDVTVTGSMGSGASVVASGGAGNVNVTIPVIATGGPNPSVIEFGNGGTPGCVFAGDLTMAGGINQNTGVQIFGSLASGASIDLSGQDVAGKLYIREGGPGTIINGGVVTAGAYVTLADLSGHTFTGSATFAQADPGAIIHTGHGADMNGTLTVGGDMNGRVDVTGTLGSRGRILVDGLCDGTITVGEETRKLSLIDITGGIGAAGSVTVNSLNNNYNANGDIYIGPTKWTQMPNPPFDGSIQINKGTGSGDLNGVITVVGCHDNDLAICVEGTVNGEVNIV